MPRTYAHLKKLYINNGGIEKIATGPGCRVMVRQVAEKMKAHAEGISPEDEGVYKTSFRVKLHIRRDWPHDSPYRAARVCADLANVAPHAIIVERGVQVTGPKGGVQRRNQFRVLGKTLVAFRAAHRGSKR
ncbi:hypothetical protein E1091_01145 [Micromonospora fluostatini]|uniref:50S ribosomal protein L22 n=1 Tax=Micromonospora fluostatini TaxID=1629071 RepID=A0ABY2DLR4_9ACTN|nr:hypothetical protein E1091_01145 [Micromonospora fluostatini]